MRKVMLGSLLGFALFTQAAMAGQSPDADPRAKSEGLPTFMISGLHAYKDSGPDEAVKIWLKGSALEGDSGAMNQASFLRQALDSYGAYESFEVISSHNLTARTRVIYLALDYARGPAFAKFMVYRSDQGWILMNFTFDMRAEAILPPPL